MLMEGHKGAVIELVGGNAGILLSNKHVEYECVARNECINYSTYTMQFKILRLVSRSNAVPHLIAVDAQFN